MPYKDLEIRMVAAREYTRQWWLRNRDNQKYKKARAETHRRWYLKNKITQKYKRPPLTRAQKYRDNSQLRLRNSKRRPKIRAYNNQWWANLPKSVRQKKSREKYLRSTPERLTKLRVAANKRRALASNGDFTSDDVADLLKAQNRKCSYCVKRINSKTATIDHSLPISRGGTHHRSNIVLACEKCNKSKGAKTSAEFHQWRLECTM